MVNFSKSVFYLTGAFVMAALVFVLYSHLQSVEKIKRSELNFLYEESSEKNIEKKQYVLQEVEGRTLLMDKKTGEIWRYYFNNIGDQGWSSTRFDQFEMDGKTYYRNSPDGEFFFYPSVPKK